MNVNANWSRWIHSSISKHFDDNRGGVALYIEGAVRLNPEPEPRFELRVDGPYYQEVSAGVWFINVEINLLIFAQRDDTQFYLMQTLEGKGAAIFADAIPVMKYGNGPDDNRTSMLGCLVLRSNGRDEIITSRFGLIDPTRRVSQSTVEGHYQMQLKI